MLEILYQDDFIAAINKPHGLLVHRTKMANEADEFAIQLLRDQIGLKVYPVHRLDRKTSGVLLFALSEEANTNLQNQFMNREVGKTYQAIVRGYTNDEGTIDYSLTNENGKTQDAITHFTTLRKNELDFPSGVFPTSRYSLISISPETGRFHQIRKHMAHLRHPIIGDRPHGCNKQNKIFLERFNMNTMMLHASELIFQHPKSGERVVIRAEIQSEFKRMIASLKLSE